MRSMQKFEQLICFRVLSGIPKTHLDFIYSTELVESFTLSDFIHTRVTCEALERNYKETGEFLRYEAFDFFYFFQAFNIYNYFSDKIIFMTLYRLKSHLSR